LATGESLYLSKYLTFFPAFFGKRKIKYGEFMLARFEIGEVKRNALILRKTANFLEIF